MSEKSKFSTQVEWGEGSNGDFKELHEAIQTGKAGQNEFTNEESSDNEEEDLDKVPDQLADFQKELRIPENEDLNSEEEDEETEPDQPGPKLLWAAQKDNVELIQTLLKENKDLVKYVDSDGYTALHRSAYSGNKVSIFQFDIHLDNLL